RLELLVVLKRVINVVLAELERAVDLPLAGPDEVQLEVALGHIDARLGSVLALATHLSLRGTRRRNGRWRCRDDGSRGCGRHTAARARAAGGRRRAACRCRRARWWRWRRQRRRGIDLQAARERLLSALELAVRVLDRVLRLLLLGSVPRALVRGLRRGGRVLRRGDRGVRRVDARLLILVRVHAVARLDVLAPRDVTIVGRVRLLALRALEIGLRPVARRLEAIDPLLARTGRRRAGLRRGNAALQLGARVPLRLGAPP